MASQNRMSTVRGYLRSIADTHATGHATEHSYRPALQTLIEALGGDGVKALNEPSHVECGAPDFIVEHNGVPIGHIECKDVGAHLSQVEESDQLKRYREGLPNLVLTDYLEFRWYVDGSLRQSARIGYLTPQGGFTVEKSGAQQFVEMIDAFFTTDIPSIDNPRDLAKRMAVKARLLKDGVDHILAQESESGPLHDLLKAYREILISDLSPTDFADLQAQTAAYGLFAARCGHQPGSGPFNRQSAIFAETTPLLRDVFGRIAGPAADQRIAWIVDDLARLLARADMSAVLADFGSRTAKEGPLWCTSTKTSWRPTTLTCERCGVSTTRLNLWSPTSSAVSTSCSVVASASPMALLKPRRSRSMSPATAKKKSPECSFLTRRLVPAHSCVR